MQEHGLAWIRHSERMEEVASIASERELARAARGAREASGAPASIRRRIGYGLMRVGARIAAGAGS